MKKCPKCGRTSPPALVACPRCKTPFNATITRTSAGRQAAGSSRSEEDAGSTSRTRTVVTTSVLIVLVLVLASVLFMKRHGVMAIFSGLQDNFPVSSRQIVRPANFNELLGTWTGREINRSSGWTFIFSPGYNVSASGPEGWYRGKASIHWELGGDRDGMRVPPGAGILDVDIDDTSAGDYRGKTSVGAFAVYYGTTLKLCSGEPGKTKRPESFDPASGIRCFELTKTAEAPAPIPSQQAQPAKADVPTAQIPAASDGEVAAAREAFKNCVAAYKAGNISEAKKYIGSKDLPEMEQSGMLDMAMGMMSGLNIDEFSPTQDGNRLIFKKSEKQGDMTSSMSIKMVKEDGQWKLGK
jgi:hypothetical protein